MKKRAYIFWAIFALCNFKVLSQDNKVVYIGDFMKNSYFKHIGSIEDVSVNRESKPVLFENHLSYIYTYPSFIDTTQNYRLDSYYLAQDTLIYVYGIDMTRECYYRLNSEFSRNGLTLDQLSSYTYHEYNNKNPSNPITLYEVAWEIDKRKKLILSIENTYDEKESYLRSSFHLYSMKGNKRTIINSFIFEDPSLTFSNIVPYILDIDSDGKKELALIMYGGATFDIDFYKINIPQLKKSKKLKVKKPKGLIMTLW